jgi:hypothetical protein
MTLSGLERLVALLVANHTVSDEASAVLGRRQLLESALELCKLLAERRR